jgi:hypothetical protein
MGRPTKYKKEYCKEIIEFYSCEPFEDIDLPHYDNDGVTVKWTDKKRMANKLPTMVQFAKHIKCGVSTVYDWLDPDHASYQKEFSDTYIHAKRLQKDVLIQNGLLGLYNPAFAKFVAVNFTTMRDKQDTESQITVNISAKPIEKDDE